jgi:hypothetical protein
MTNGLRGLTKQDTLKTLTSCIVPRRIPLRALGTAFPVAPFAASKITIPAVKITGAPTLPLLEDDESMMLAGSLCPNPCLSSIGIKMVSDTTADVDEIEGDVEDAIPSLLPNLEDEFGDFLLDAVDWL